MAGGDVVKMPAGVRTQRPAICGAFLFPPRPASGTGWTDPGAILITLFNNPAGRSPSGASPCIDRGGA